MRFFDKLRRYGFHTIVSGRRSSSGHGTVEHHRTVDHLPASAPIPPVRVVADEVFAFYWEDERDIFEFDHDFGPVRAPFPVMWIEGRQPATICINGGDRVPSSRDHAGAIVISQPVTDELLHKLTSPHRLDAFPRVEEAVELITMVGGFEMDGTALWVPATHAYFVNEAGEVLGDADSRVLHLTPWRDGDHPALAMADVCFVRPILLTLSLMNCKNVKIEDQPAPKIGKKTKRVRTPELSYSHIRLPKPRHAGESIGETGGAAPLHLVRGHFKTYTEEAPLFGSRVGTWWWSWQARGNIEHGQRIPEYEVGTE